MKPTMAMMGLLLAAAEAAGQPFLYNAARDDAAQKAEAAAREMSSGILTDKQLRNVDTIARMQAERVVSFARVQMSAGVQAFTHWDEVNRQMDGVIKRNAPQAATPDLAGLRARKQAAEGAAGQLKEKLAELSQGASPGEGLQELLSVLQKAEEIREFVAGFDLQNERVEQAVDAAQFWLATARSISDAFMAARAARVKMQKELAGLNQPNEVELLQRLNLEIAQLKQELQNQAWRELETGKVILLARTVQGRMKAQDSAVRSQLQNG